jgi:endonuclease IV
MHSDYDLHCHDLASDYDYVIHAWILEAIREIKTARKLGIDLINFHANINGMFYGEKRKIVLDNLVKSLSQTHPLYLVKS